MRIVFSALTLYSFLVASSPTLATQLSDLTEPEFGNPISEGRNERAPLKKATSESFMVVAAHPLATQLGTAILNAGGNAVDAMVTVQATLGLVEPQSSGLGGGAFTLYYNAKTKDITAYDGRETAPLAVDEKLFIKEDQTPMGFFEAVVGGRSVGTPGTVALLWHMHQKHGALAWQDVLQPVIALSNNGFEVSPRMAASIQRDRERLATHPETAKYFLPNGVPLKSGTTLTNPSYAKSLEELAKHGGAYFYTSDFAKEIVRAVKDSQNPGYLSIRDFKEYKVIERRPTCSAFLDHKVCGIGAPSSGALSVGQILRIAEKAGLKKYEPESPQAWHLVAEATRLAFADRGLYIADPEFFNVPTDLLNDEYLNHRALKVNPKAKSETILPGKLDNQQAALVSGFPVERPSTSHFSIIDKAGNIISSTTTIENGFGSRIMAKGFLLNNELTDFSFRYENDGGLIANRVQPGKRPRSSMAPTIVLSNGEPSLVIGSPGGSRIINYVANSLIRYLAWNIPLYDAINAPHISNRFGDMDLEDQRWPDDAIRAFKDLGYKTNLRDLNSGIHAIAYEKGRLIGAADERREGSVGVR